MLQELGFVVLGCSEIDGYTVLEETWGTRAECTKLLVSNLPNCITGCEAVACPLFDWFKLKINDPFPTCCVYGEIVATEPAFQFCTYTRICEEDETWCSDDSCIPNNMSFCDGCPGDCDCPTGEHYCFPHRSCYPNDEFCDQCPGDCPECTCNDQIIQEKCAMWRSEFPKEITGVICIDDTDEATPFNCTNASVVPGLQCPTGAEFIGSCSLGGVCNSGIFAGLQCLQSFETDYGNFALNLTYQGKQNIGTWTVVHSETLPHKGSGVFFNLENGNVLFGSGHPLEDTFDLKGDMFYGMKFTNKASNKRLCAGRCGYHSESKCWCDDTCRYHNDCCADICESCDLFCDDYESSNYFDKRSTDYAPQRTGKTVTYGVVGALIVLVVGFVGAFKRRVRGGL